MTEVFNNYGPITLALACGISDPTITVTNASALSTLGNYRLLIDDEIMLATSLTGSVVSVLRAQEGTTAAAHSLSVPVEPIVSAGALNQLRADAGGLQGYVSVVNGTPETLSQTQQVAGCQSSGGTTVVNMPATPGPTVVAGMRVLIFDDQNNASNNNIAVGGNGSNVEDPNAPGTFTSSVSIKVSSMAVMWVYDGTKWKVAGSTSTPGGWATRPILAGVASTQNGSTNPLRVGALLFRPTDESSGRKVWFRVCLETTGASYQANIALFDVNNVLGGGAGAMVPGSLLQTVATSVTELEVELSAAGGNLETLVSDILLTCCIWLTTTLSGQSVTCSMASLNVDE
jgi:hypothetical protein